MTSDGRLLLDTCAIIWLSEGLPFDPVALKRIREAEAERGIYVSPISAWEIGHLTKPRGTRGPRMRLAPDPLTWFERFTRRPGVRHTPITAEIAIHSSFLPGDLHEDPADRILIATALHLGVPLVTSDKKILAYARAGYLQAIPCSRAQSAQG